MINVTLVAITKHLDEDESPEALIARAGGVCYKSEERDDLENFVRTRVKQKHLSVTEHVALTFEIGGVSRACLAQLDRIGSYSVESQRRVGMRGAKFVVPPSIMGNPAALEIFNKSVASTVSAYSALRELGVKKQDSRFVLPLATETKLVMTMNLRALRLLFQTRLGGGSQWEIRTLAERMLEIAYRAVPSAFEDLYTVYVKGKDY